MRMNGNSIKEKEKPLVSIGMGVYNAEQFLAIAIQSILDQDYPNIELVISDNGSQDESEKIYRDFAKKDSRVTYRRNNKNINPLKNWCMLLDMCQGVYHTWAADHDFHHPKFISSLVGKFERNDDNLIMAYTDARYIDVNGIPIREIQEDIDTRGLSAPERFRKVMWGLTYCTPMYGLFRSETLKKTYVERSITGPDRVFMAEYSLLGTFARHKKPLFFMRQNRPPENYIQTKKRQMKWFVPNRYESFVPTIMRDYEHIKVVQASCKLNTIDKETIVEDILRWHHADPHKHSEREVGRLIQSGIKVLTSQEYTEKEKINAAKEYARIVNISRPFRPGLSSEMNGLFDLSKKVLKKDRSDLCNKKLPKKVNNIHMDDESCGRLSGKNDSVKNPLVTIGMPVFNQSPYFEKAIETILAQSYKNFELIISDNDSNNRFVEMCEFYAKTDKRIRVIKHKYNMGWVANADIVFNSGTGKYLHLSTGRDLYHPEYISSLVKTFTGKQRSIVMCYPRSAYIDENDKFLPGASGKMVDTGGMGPVERFKNTIWNFNLEDIYSGLFRKPALLNAWTPYTARGPVYMLAAKLSLLGSIAPIDSKLFYKRIDQEDKKCTLAKQKYAKRFSLTKTEEIIPFTMLAFEHISAVLGSDLNKNEKDMLCSEIKICFTERFGLENEALAFLQKGIELLKTEKQKLKYSTYILDEMKQLAKICEVFNPAYRVGLKKIANLLGHVFSVGL